MSARWPSAGGGGGDALDDGRIVITDPTGTGGNDTGKVVDALTTAKNAGGGFVFLGPGNWSVNPNQVALGGTTGGDVMIGGCGAATEMTKTGNGVLIDLSGTNEANMRGRMQVRDMFLKGADFTGPLIRGYHVFQAHLRNVEFFGNNGPAVDYAHAWDSYFDDLFAEWCGKVDGTEAAIRLRNSAASSGFGFTTDSVNEIWMSKIRLENFRAGLHIGKGVNNTADPFGFSLRDFKLETSKFRGFPLEVVDARDVRLQSGVVTAIGFDDGFSTAGVGIFWGPVGPSAMRDIRIYQSGAYMWYGLQSYAGAGGTHEISNVYGQGTAFGGGFARWETTNLVTVKGLSVQAGTLESGTRVKYEKGVNVHNGTSYPTRPGGFGSVEWIGPTDPGGAAVDGDTWVPTA